MFKTATKWSRNYPFFAENNGHVRVGAYQFKDIN